MITQSLFSNFPVVIPISSNVCGPGFCANGLDTSGCPLFCRLGGCGLPPGPPPPAPMPMPALFAPGGGADPGDAERDPGSTRLYRGAFANGRIPPGAGDDAGDICGCDALWENGCGCDAPWGNGCGCDALGGNACCGGEGAPFCGGCRSELCRALWMIWLPCAAETARPFIGPCCAVERCRARVRLRTMVLSASDSCCSREIRRASGCESARSRSAASALPCWAAY